MSDTPNEAMLQTASDKHNQLTLPQTAEPQTQGQQEAQDEQGTQPSEGTAHLQPPPESAQNRGEDALDVALQGSMITSDPPSTLMPENED